MCKIDISDGFYREWLLPADILKLGVVLPMKDGEDPLIGPPLALPIGLVNLQPYFCADTKPIYDLAKTIINACAIFKDHPLEKVSDTPFPSEIAMPLPCNAPSKLAALSLCMM
jgi:hypothetical protein